MNKIYWLILGWMNFLSWTSAFMALWLKVFNRIEAWPFVGILIFSILSGFFSVALMKDAWEKETQWRIGTKS